MPATYILIASNTLSSAAASVTFNSIPGTYTDLLLKISARNVSAGNMVADLKVTINSSSASNYSTTYIFGNGSTASTGRTSGLGYLQVKSGVNGGALTSNTFSSTEIYIANYALSQNKPMDSVALNETNATAAEMHSLAMLWRDNTAITSLLFEVENGTNFATGSSFWLYGIKNS